MARRFGWRNGVANAKGLKGENDNVFNDKIWIPASDLSLQTSGTAATAGSQGDSFVLLFDQTSVEDSNYTMHLPSWPNSSLKVVAKLYWSSGDTNGNDVVWDVDYAGYAEGETKPSTTNVTVTDTDNSSANALNVTDIMEMTSNANAGDMFVMSIYRDAGESADTLSADAKLHGVTLEVREN